MSPLARAIAALYPTLNFADIDGTLARVRYDEPLPEGFEPPTQQQIDDKLAELALPAVLKRKQIMCQLDADAKAEQQSLTALATKLGYAEKDSASFIAHCERANAEWVRASELDSPAPRGHFLRTMGQSDRDFVENANPNAAIPQALALMNSDLVSTKGVLSPFSPLMNFVNRAATPEARTEAAFLALLSRKPTAAEMAAFSKTSASTEDLIYALLNTKQFMFIQ